MKRKRPYFHYSSHSDRREAREQEESMEKRKKKIKWNEEAEHLLIQLWQEYVGSLRGNRKSGLVYQEMANEMVNEGHNFTGDEVRVKVHNLTNKYKLEKRSIAHNGGYSTWNYYDNIHSILNSIKCQTIEEVVEETKDPDPDPDPEPELEPEPDQIEESMCSIEAIESYKPAENKERRKRRRDEKSVYGSDILKMLRDSTDIMKREAEDRRRADAKMLRLQEELVEIERERNDILKEMLS